MSGKGSKQRPRQVPHEKYSENWDLIFGKKEIPANYIIERDVFYSEEVNDDIDQQIIQTIEDSKSK